MKLTAAQVKAAETRPKEYKLADGRGLHLLVKPGGGKYWRMKYRFGGKEKQLAVGVYPETSLARAREKHQAARDQLNQGIDPSVARRLDKVTQAQEGENTFKRVGLEWYETQMGGKSDSYRDRTKRLLENDLYPALGHRPINQIEPPELLMALRKVEKRGAVDMAHRAKQTAGQVFRYGVATGRCARDPSGDLRGALTPRNKKHYASIIDPAGVGQLLVAIDGFQGTPVVKTALQLSPLVFQRPGEVRTMEWAEIDWEEKRWEIPAAKMKMKEPHIVPLSKQALALLRGIERYTAHRGKYVFPSQRGASRPLSDNGVRTALRTCGYANDTMTPHGFRAMARTILDEVLQYRVDFIEHQLAHQVRDANGRAYNRTAHLADRRKMMQGWADYLDNLKAQTKAGNVITANFGKGAGQ